MAITGKLLIAGMILIMIFTLILIPVAYQASVKRREWLSANCKIIGEISGSSTIAVGVGANGAVTVTPVYISGKTGYQCNDSKTYWE